MDARVIGWAVRRVFSTVGSKEDPWSDGLGALRTTKGFRGKLSAFLRAYFPPRRVIAKTYALSPDAARIYLYYPVRMAGLLGRHFPRAWRLLRRDEKMVAWAERE
jgi:hypothetical protein